MLDLPHTFMGTAGLISDVEAGRVAAELVQNNTRSLCHSVSAHYFNDAHDKLISHYLLTHIRDMICNATHFRDINWPQPQLQCQQSAHNSSGDVNHYSLNCVKQLLSASRCYVAMTLSNCNNSDATAQQCCAMERYRIHTVQYTTVTSAPNTLTQLSHCALHYC
eukprot:10590-Heterococcus_DN1.PRE.1